MRVSSALLLAPLLGLPACNGGAGNGSSASSNGSTSTTDATTSVGTTASSDTATGSSSDTVATTGAGGECSLETQDCPDADQKCMPWSLEDDSIPDSTRCCPLDDNPKVEGDECTIADYNGSCVDDCGKGLVCLLDREDTLQGYCHTLCDVNQDACMANQTCKPFFENLVGVQVVPLCMEQCDPLLQDCTRPNWTCIPDSPTDAGMSGFLCSPPPPGPRQQLFDGCALANQCEAGLTCVPQDRLANCNQFLCCTQFCSLSEPDPCPGLDPSLECVDWMAPDPKWADVGVCAVPL